MDRFTTDNPQSNMESAYNIFQIKNKETICYLTDDNSEISLYELMRRCAKTLDCRVSYEDTDDSIGEFLYDRLFDGADSPEGILAHFYTTAWAFSVLRAKLKDYEDTNLTPADIGQLKAKNDALRAELAILAESHKKMADAYHDCGGCKNSLICEKSPHGGQGCWERGVPT